MTTSWGRRAADLYSADYARRYRDADDQIHGGELVSRFSAWLGGLCASFERPIDVLDLGCGTGRYFHALTNVRSLVGIDVSAPMLEHARGVAQDTGVAAGHVSTVCADFLSHDFASLQFDLVYSIGVLAEHSPFDEAVARRVHHWLRAGGVFAFTAVHAHSFSVPRTLKRRIGEAVLPAMRGGAREALRRRLMAGGLYADEERLRDVLHRTGFDVVSIEDYTSDVHRHLLATARKR